MSDERRAEKDSFVLGGARVVLPAGVMEGARVVVEDGHIVRIAKGGETTAAGRAYDLAGLTLYPGFIDVHIHGAVGVDTMEASADDLHRAALFLASKGITGWLPTLVPGPDEDYRRAVGAMAELWQRQDVDLPPAARALGVHYEGPFVNLAQCGALRTDYFRTYADSGDLNRLVCLPAPGAAHMITLAPEIEGGLDLVRELSERGWVVSIGHTRADVEQLDRALAAGARHMTHFLNAMLPLHHRTPGPVGWGLVRDEVTCDVVADGHHVNPMVLQAVLRCKTADRLTLISDAVAPAGLGDGSFGIWGETITVKDGRTSNERGSIAGSVISMLEAVKMMLSIGASETEVARMASLNPARLTGWEKECGSIEPGKRADLVALDQHHEVRLTLIGGREAFNALG